MPELNTPVMFPTHVPIQELPKHEYNFGDLDYLTQQELLEIMEYLENTDYTDHADRTRRQKHRSRR